MDIQGTNLSDEIIGTEDADFIEGLGGDDTLTGLGGNDTINGGTGADTMIGGEGDDFYTIDNAGDIIVELADEGTDGVYVTGLASYTLHDNVENLSVYWGDAGTFSGNGLHNTIWVSLDDMSDVTIYGEGGNDTISLTNSATTEDSFGTVYGGDGDDVITGTAASDDMVIHTNYLHGGADNDTIYGANGVSAVNYLWGDEGNDVLYSVGDNSTLWGGTGDDTYYLSSASVIVSENAGEGTDTIIVSLDSYTLGDNFENLSISNDGDVFAGGNDLDNVISVSGSNGFIEVYGEGGADTINVSDGADDVEIFGGDGDDHITVVTTGEGMLDGGSGADIMDASGSGDEVTFYVDDENDVILPSAIGGALVYLSAGTYELVAGVDTVWLNGNGPQTITGHATEGISYYNVGADDTIYGGSGDDFYRIDDVAASIIEQADGGYDRVLIQGDFDYVIPDTIEEVNLQGSGTLTGNANDNVMRTNGTTTMIGGLGDDVYYVFSAATVVELDAEGTDTVYVGDDYTLGDNLENLIVEGFSRSAGIALTGNELDNYIRGWNGVETIMGMEGNDILDGGRNADTMIGGIGNDTYYVDNTGDVIVELEDEGTDTVIASLAAYTLGGHFEDLTINYAGSTTGSGNALDNVITGGSDVTYFLAYGFDGNDTLDASATSGATNLFGGEGDDTLIGTDENDALFGDEGADTMSAGLGNDDYFVDNVGDVVTELEGEGDDTLILTAAITYTLPDHVELGYVDATGGTIIGNDLNNTLQGGAAGTLAGGLGNDIYDLTEFSGMTLVENADEGTDTVRVSSNYTLLDNFENLTGLDLAGASLRGNSDANEMQISMSTGSTATTYAFGEGGDDTIRLYGWDFGDTLSSGYASGGTGEDRLYAGEEGIAVLDGNGGNDTLYDQGNANATLQGGVENDTYYIENSASSVVELDGQGTDTVITSVNSYELSDFVENLQATGIDVFSYAGNAIANEISVTAQADGEIYGGGGNDIITVTGNADVEEIHAYGGDDNDTITVSASDAEVYLYGDAGDDHLIATSAADVILDGGTGADIMDASATGVSALFYVDDAFDIVIASDLASSGPFGNEIVLTASSYVLPDHIGSVDLVGTGGQFVIGSADDTAFRDIGNLDVVSGGSGDDTYVVEEAGFTIIENADEGYDRVILNFDTDYTIGANIEEASLYGVGTLTGSDNDDVLRGGGDATLVGGLGDDTYRFSGVYGTVVENADEGIDTVIIQTSYTLGANLENLAVYGATDSSGLDMAGNELDNVITGWWGIERLYGHEGADIIYADDLDSDEIVDGSTDFLYGGGGNDTLYAVRGNDSLYGEAGWDTLVSGTGDDLMDGGNGRDTASYASAAAGVTVSLAIATAQDTIGAGNDTLVGMENLRGSGFADTLTGDVDVNYLWGGGADDAIYAGGGSDLLVGEDGDDTLYGESGWDNMRGDDGNDTLWGGNGGDLMKGNAGNDTFYGGDGYDRVYGGNDNDTAWGGADTDDLYGQAGDDTLYGEDGDDLLQGNNGADMLDGGADNDSLDGGSGNDTLLGGEGDDVLTGSWGIDTLTGGAGADTFAFASGHTGRWEANADIITDFSQSDGDLIDLSAFDADSSTGGDDAFTFIGDAAFSGTAGELRYSSDGTRTLVEGDTDGDGVADFALVLDGDIALQGADFVL